MKGLNSCGRDLLELRRETGARETREECWLDLDGWNWKPGRAGRVLGGDGGREKQNGVRIKSLGTLRKSFTTRTNRKSICTILRYYHSNG